MVRRYEDLSDLEKLSLIDMSYSRLNTYDLCAARYFYTYITKEERLFGPAATLGNCIHFVLENNIETLNLADMVEDFEAIRLDLDPELQISDELIEVGYTLLQEFCDRHSGEDIEVVAVEMPFEIVIGSGFIRGFIDRVDRLPDGSLSVVDYKSGSYEIAAKNAPDDLQLGIYALALSTLYPHTVIHAELYYLRTGRHKGHTFSPGDLVAVERKVAEKIQAIIEDQNFSATSEYRPCTFCDYAKGICPTGTNRMKRRS